MTKFLVDSFALADRSGQQGRTATAREVLDTGARRVATGLLGQPALKARLSATMGQAYQNLAVHDRAQTLLEEALALTDYRLKPVDLVSTESRCAAESA